MISVATFVSTEEAEELGERLLEGGVTPQIKHTTVYVAAEDLERALRILDFDDAAEPAPPPPAFHPCPQCGASDPIWYGRRKAMVWLVLLAVLIAMMLLRLPSFAFVSIASFIVFMIAVAKIPEWKCRQCGHRWSKEKDQE